MSDLIVTPGFTKSGLPYVIFDNVFSDNELSRMMLEIDLNIKPVMRRENTGGTEKSTLMQCFFMRFLITQRHLIFI